MSRLTEIRRGLSARLLFILNAEIEKRREALKGIEFDGQERGFFGKSMLEWARYRARVYESPERLLETVKKIKEVS